MTSFEELRNEFVSGSEPILNWEIVLDCSKKLNFWKKRDYRHYNDGEPWRHEGESWATAGPRAAMDLASETMAEELLGRDQFQTIYEEASSIDDLRKGIRFYLIRTLGKRRKQTVVDNLVGRISDIAKEEGWERQFRHQASQSPSLSDREKRLMVDSLIDIPRVKESVTPKDSKVYEPKASPVFKKIHLKELVGRVRERHPKAVRKDFREILDDLLVIWYPAALNTMEDEEKQRKNQGDTARNVEDFGDHVVEGDDDPADRYGKQADEFKAQGQFDKRLAKEAFYEEARSMLSGWERNEIYYVWLKLQNNTQQRIEDELGMSAYLQKNMWKSCLEKITEFTGVGPDADVKSKVFWEAVNGVVGSDDDDT